MRLKRIDLALSLVALLADSLAAADSAIKVRVKATGPRKGITGTLKLTPQEA